MIKGWQKILAKIAKLLYEGKLKGDISPEMVTAHANYLFEAVDTNVPKSIAAKDTAMMFNMRRNVFHFSGAKNWQQLQEMSRLVKDIQGNARPFNEFLKDVKTIDKTYNATYLKAEYGLATRSAKNAAKWSRFQSEKELFPNLRYEAVGDARTRPEHAALDGIVKPIDHPFWKKYYPPNGWNCRCTVQQEDSDTPVTPNSETSIPENVPPVMQGNAGIDGVIFSSKHPYFITIPKSLLLKVLEQSEQLAYSNATKIAEAQKIYSKPRAEQFITIIEIERGGKILQHELYEKGKDHADVMTMATLSLNAGKKVELLPKIHFKEEAARKLIMPGVKKSKNPDLSIDGELWEVKKPETSIESNIKNNVLKASRQADNVAIFINKKISKGKLYRWALAKMKDVKTLKTISFFNKKEVLLTYKRN